MDNLGVAMNDTTLNAYALEKGINKTTQEMTNQEKIGLAMEMFMEKTAYAAGNYAKENETLAGSLGTAKAALSNFLSGAGTVDDVVSSLTNAGSVIVKNITAIFPSLMGGLISLVQQLVPEIPPLLQSLLPSLITGAVDLVNGVVAALPSILSALLAALPALLDGIMNIMNAVIAALPQIMDMLISALPGLIPQLITGLVTMLTTLMGALPQIIQPLLDNLPLIIISVVNALMQNLPALINGFIALVLGVVAALPQIIQSLIDALPTIIATIVEGLLRCLPDLIMGAIQLVIGIVKALPQILSSLRQALPNAMKGIWSAVKNVFADVGAWFGEKFTAAKNRIVAAFSNVKEKLSAPFNKAKDAIKGVVDKIKGFFTGLKLKFPSIKLPHFSVKPSGWKIGDLLKGSIPKLGIEWYAKAMNAPRILDAPTVFGYNAKTGELQGGGEAGSEMIGGTSTIMGMIQNAVASQNSVLVLYLQKIIEILAEYFPQLLEALDIDLLLDGDLLVAGTAHKMNKALGKINIGKDRGR
jgi:phage-related protein